MSLMSVVYCQVEVSVSGCLLIQRSPTDCGVSDCDSQASIMTRPCPLGAVVSGQNYVNFKSRMDCLLSEFINRGKNNFPTKHYLIILVINKLNAQILVL